LYQKGQAKEISVSKISRPKEIFGFEQFDFLSNLSKIAKKARPYWQD